MEHLFDIDLKEWIPKRILETISDRGGQEVQATYWNNQWNKHKDQGDYNAETIYEMLAELNRTIWDLVNGLQFITHPNPIVDTFPDIGLTASEQLTWSLLRLRDLWPLLGSQGTDLINDTTFLELVSATETEPVTEQLTSILAFLKNIHDRLQKQVDDMGALVIEAFNHNDIGQRDLFEAHPASAISVNGTRNVQEVLDELYTISNDLGDSIVEHLESVDAHAAVNLTATWGGTATSVQGALANIYTALESITGDIEKISYRHPDILDRDVAGAHPASAITATYDDATTTVQAALNTILSSKQRTVLSGTAVPASSLGVNGDIYIQYS